MNFDKNAYQSLGRLQTICLKQNIPIVSYRLPLQTEICTLVQYQSFPEKLHSLNDIDSESGFLIAPFVEFSCHPGFLLKPDCTFYGDDVLAEFTEKMKHNSFFLNSVKTTETVGTTTDENDFISQVELAVGAMNEGKFDKVVLSKIRTEKLTSNFVAADCFLELCQKYPHAFVYLIQLPEVGCWMGATPEPLILVDHQKVKTVSLAGTQLASGLDVETYRWSQKEIEEQKIVTDFVEKTLKSLGVEKYTKQGPLNYRAANLIHLKTDFEFSLAGSEQSTGSFLRALHPTPSVCGLPKMQAQEFILANETHDRAYYTGFLGPVNCSRKTNVFVNLRCVQLFSSSFVLYSGAGITSSSVAQKEWEETENKMLTMLNVITNTR